MYTHIHTHNKLWQQSKWCNHLLLLLSHYWGLIGSAYYFYGSGSSFMMRLSWWLSQPLKHSNTIYWRRLWGVTGSSDWGPELKVDRWTNTFKQVKTPRSHKDTDSLSCRCKHMDHFYITAQQQFNMNVQVSTLDEADHRKTKSPQLRYKVPVQHQHSSPFDLRLLSPFLSVEETF